MAKMFWYTESNVFLNKLPEAPVGPPERLPTHHPADTDCVTNASRVLPEAVGRAWGTLRGLVSVGGHIAGSNTCKAAG